MPSRFFLLFAICRYHFPWSLQFFFCRFHLYRFDSKSLTFNKYKKKKFPIYLGIVQCSFPAYESKYYKMEFNFISEYEYGLVSNFNFTLQLQTAPLLFFLFVLFQKMKRRPSLVWRPARAVISRNISLVLRNHTHAHLSFLPSSNYATCVASHSVLSYNFLRLFFFFFFWFVGRVGSIVKGEKRKKIESGNKVPPQNQYIKINAVKRWVERPPKYVFIFNSFLWTRKKNTHQRNEGIIKNWYFGGLVTL